MLKILVRAMETPVQGTATQRHRIDLPGLRVDLEWDPLPRTVAAGDGAANYVNSLQNPLVLEVPTHLDYDSGNYRMGIQTWSANVSVDEPIVKVNVGGLIQKLKDGA